MHARLTAGTLVLGQGPARLRGKASMPCNEAPYDNSFGKVILRGHGHRHDRWHDPLLLMPWQLKRRIGWHALDSK